MKTTSVTLDDLCGVFPVPPLARRRDGTRSLDFDESARVVKHLYAGGLTRFVYGGNAFLYHVSLAEYEAMVAWLAGFDAELWAIPSAGPSFGRALDQTRILARHRFPAVMMLPCADPRDAAGLEQGLREIADRAATPLILYIKDEGNFGADREAGLDVVGRLVDAGICVGIKYAVVRKAPAPDPYLTALLERVPRGRVVSGIGERPAIVHMRDFGLPGFTTGSGCLAPRRTELLFEACQAHDYARAEALRAEFLPLEDLRDAGGPARVLHAATELAGIAATGPIPPFVSELPQAEREALAPVARALFARNREVALGTTVGT